MILTILLFIYINVAAGMLLHEYIEDERITKDKIKLATFWPYALLCKIPVFLFCIRAIMPINLFYINATNIGISTKKQNKFKDYFDGNIHLFEKQVVRLKENDHTLVFITDSKNVDMPSSHKWIPLFIFDKMTQKKGEKIFLEDNNPNLYYHVWKISNNMFVIKRV